MTNYEKIKNMSVEEMAEWLDEIISSNPCYVCVKDDIGKYDCWIRSLSDISRTRLCLKNRELWLQSEIEE